MFNIDDDHALELRVAEDFSNTNIRLGDYIRLRGLCVGDILYLQDPNRDTKVIFIGNGTPYEGVSSVSHDGWYWDVYNAWTLLKVVRLAIAGEGEPLSPVEVEVVQSELNRARKSA